ncbi:quinoprotein dehydrogenase-associated SoxYZ-like carrier [uncultured Methylobacterium sp.]|uniref:quinoprotein dehydrogenase-associated SoxYZ-like carrier n=1 Tax=uncultured Methylobacterium sp. TaxID=157278 RepID=UPI0035CAEBEA
MAGRFLGGRPAVFDERVQVVLPPVTEDQTHVPVTVDARDLGRADEILLIADLNPFPLTLRLEPVAAASFIALRMKIEQGTPIRAAVRQGDLWHVGGRYLDAAGGYSVPPVVEKKTDWKSLGNTRAEIWREPEGLRLRLRITHPMDNGMIPGVSVFFIETLAVSDAAGAPMAKLTLSEAIADDPTLTLLLDAPPSGDVLTIAGRNTGGMDFSARVPIPPGATARRREGRL